MEREERREAPEMFQKVGHGPVEEKAPGFRITVEPPLDFLSCGLRIQPEIILIGGTKGIPGSTDDARHGPPSGHVAGGESLDFSFAPGGILPELYRIPILKGDKQAGLGGRPFESALDESKFRNHNRMEKPAQVGAGRDVDARPGFFERTGASDPFARLQHDNVRARARQVRPRTPARCGRRRRSRRPSPGPRASVGAPAAQSGPASQRLAEGLRRLSKLHVQFTSFSRAELYNMGGRSGES